MSAAVIQFPASRRQSGVERAWIAAIGDLQARERGAPVPASADRVMKALDRLYRQRRIDLAHARVLRIWGERGMAPSVNNPAERTDARLWAEAMAQLEHPLRCQGVVR